MTDVLKNRIAFVHSNNIDVGGSDFNMKSLVFAAKSSGYIPVVFLSHNNNIVQKYIKAGIKVILIPMPRIIRNSNPFVHLKWAIRVLVASFKLAHLFKQQGVDIVYANDINDISALLACHIISLPSIMSLRIFFNSPPLIRIIYMSLISILSNKVVCNSMAVREYNYNNTLCRKNNINTIYNWYERNNKEIKKLSLKDADKEFGIPTEAKVVLMPGRKEHWKGQHVLVDASKEIINSIEDVYILFVGPTVTGRGREKYEDELIKRAKELGTLDRIVFADYVENIGDLMQAADIMVHCSVTPEPFGMTVLEALHYGTPLVASRAGGPLEIVGSPPAALLHEPGDANNLASCVIRLLKDKNLAEEIVARGFVRAAEFSKEKHWPKYKKLFEELLSK